MEDNIIELIMQILPFLIPLAILQLTLMIVALVHVLRNPHYRVGNRTIWILVVLLINIIGPIIYFVFGRGDSEAGVSE